MLTLKSSFNRKQIKAALRKMAFKNGRLKCPHCSCFKVRSIEKRYYCLRCRKKFSLASSTWLKHIKLPLEDFAALLECWLSGSAVLDASNHLKISRPTVYRYFRLFRLNIAKTLDFKPEKKIQVDEAYFGQFKKQANCYHGQRMYRVTDKTCVFGMICPPTKQLFTRVIPIRPGQVIKSIIGSQVPREVTVYSDKSPYYTHLQYSHSHIARSHDQSFEYSQYIESCWSWMKRKLFRQYHHFTKKYAPEYVQELTWRFNTRKDDKNPLNCLIKLT
ncbi:MAG: IS1595 family transposase [Candidatus Sungbacteria bacterium]|nr:IS1595 family transposase [Candidatus Sungbacteria bacterium]